MQFLLRTFLRWQHLGIERERCRCVPSTGIGDISDCYSNPHGNANQHTDEYSYYRALADTHKYSDRHANLAPVIYAHSYAYIYRYSHTWTYLYADRHTYAGSNLYGYPNVFCSRSDLQRWL